MRAYRLLLADLKERIPHQLPATLGQISHQGLEIEVATGPEDILARILRTSYDAVFYWADGEEDLAGAGELLKARPGLPLVLLSGQATGGETPARSGEPFRIHRIAPSTRLLAEQIYQLTRSGNLVKEPPPEEPDRRAPSGVHNPSRASRPVIYPRVFAPLLVEDDPEQVLLIIRAFRKAEIQVPLPVLASAEEAMDYLSRAERFPQKGATTLPSLLLLDVGLPGMSGFELLAWIRKESPHPRLAVVILSASSNPSDVNRAHELGANSYMIKPTGFSALVDLVVGLERYWGMFNEPLHH